MISQERESNRLFVGLIVLARLIVRRLAIVLALSFALLLSLARLPVGLTFNKIAVGNARPWSQMVPGLLPPCTVDAQAQLPASIKFDGLHSVALTTTGRALWLAGHCEDAIATWVKAAENKHHPATILLLLSPEWKRIPAAERSQASQYAQMIGARETANGALSSARDWYQLSWKVYPNIDSAQWLADNFIAVGKVKEAASLWTTTGEAISSSQWQHWFALGKSAELQGEWVRAAENFGVGASLGSEPPLLYLLQGEAYEKAGLIAEAERAYSEAVRTNPSAPEPYAAIVSLSRRQGNDALATAWQQRADAAVVGSASRLSLGYGYLVRGEFKAARPYIEQWYREHPDDAWSTYLWALLLWGDHDRAAAIEALLKAVQLNDGRPGQWQRLLGDWYLETGDKDRARQAYLTAIEWGVRIEEVQAQLEQSK